MKLSLDLAGDQEPPGTRIDRDEPIRMDLAAILVGFIERRRRQLVDNAVEKVLAELDFGRGLRGPAMSMADDGEQAGKDRCASIVPSWLRRSRRLILIDGIWRPFTRNRPV